MARVSTHADMEIVDRRGDWVWARATPRRYLAKGGR
jgi:hypothetical protein